MNIKECLEELGYKLTDFGSHWRTNALYRGGKTNTSVQVYKDTGVWIDHGGENQYLPFEFLIQKTLGTNDPEILSKYVGGGKLSIIKERKKTFLKEEKTYPDSCLAKLLPHYDFYLANNKRISEANLKKYEGGLATSGKFYQRFVFPIRNRRGKIHGFSGRTMSGNSVKWLHIGKKLNWVYPYFNIEEVAESIREKGEVFLVESIGDSMSLFERGCPNNLVTFGLKVSPVLCSFLCGTGARVIFSMNNNPAAKEAAVKAIIKMSPYFDMEKIDFCPPLKEDFGDMTEEAEVKAFLETTHLSNKGKRNENILEILESLLHNNNDSGFAKRAKKFKKRIE